MENALKLSLGPIRAKQKRERSKKKDAHLTKNFAFAQSDWALKIHSHCAIVMRKAKVLFIVCRQSVISLLQSQSLRMKVSL